MRKIPTVFVRDDDTNRKYVKNEPHPDCEWVFAGEGVATRKYDGTCVMFDGDNWWVRREVKPGKDAPTNYQPIETDETTGKTVGWEPADQSGFAKFLAEAVEMDDRTRSVGTYELVGPKINGNPEGIVLGHAVVAHDTAQLLPDAPHDFDGLAAWLHAHDYEGIVWHHPDGRMAKLKRKDFPAARPEGEQ